MSVTLPLEVYEVLEKNFGNEDAKKVIKSLELVISDATDYKWKVTKEELLDAIEKKFITKELFEERVNNLKELFEERINNLKLEIEKEILKLDRKFTIMFIILFFTIIFLNQNALEFLLKIFGVIK